MKLIKHKCCMCGKKATWYKAIHERGDALYYCNECVPRKSLNNVLNIEEDGEPIPNYDVMWWSENSIAVDFKNDGTRERQQDSFFYEYLDEEGKRKPSGKFAFKNDGFLIKKDEATITCDDIFKAYSETKSYLPSYQAKTIGTIITDILMEYNGFESKAQKISYNFFMSQLGDEVKDRLPLIMHKNNLHKFYISFKKILSELKYAPKKVLEPDLELVY